MKRRIDNVRPVYEGEPAEPTSVLVSDDRIGVIGDQAHASEAEEIIDGSGQWLLPGLVDLNCHLREPGPDRNGSIATETRAAARGGFTTVCAMPDTSPVNDSGAVTNLINDLARRDGAVRVLPMGAMTRGLEGERLSDMVGLSRAGCVAVSNAGYAAASARVMRRCMAYARTFDLLLYLQPENASLAAGGCAHDGAVAARLGLPGIPSVAETTAVSELLMLAEETGARLHLGPLSCARSVELLSEARARWLPVTADVAIHHLVYTEECISGYDGVFHCLPPLRSEADRRALVAGVESGVIDAICSQHRPEDAAAKLAPFGQTAPGLSCVETVLSMGLGLVARGELSRSRLIQALTTGPARVLGRPLEQLTAGATADLCLFDPEHQWEVSNASLLSAGKNAPAVGEMLTGDVSLTLVEGREVYRRG